jgi:hypothetical protein
MPRILYGMYVNMLYGFESYRSDGGEPPVVVVIIVI